MFGKSAGTVRVFFGAWMLLSICDSMLAGQTPNVPPGTTAPAATPAQKDKSATKKAKPAATGAPGTATPAQTTAPTGTGGTATASPTTATAANATTSKGAAVKAVAAPKTADYAFRGDFRPVLNNPATLPAKAEWEKLTAIVTTDKGHVVEVKVKLFANGHVIVTGALPTGETPEYLDVSSEVLGKPALRVQYSNEDVKDRSDVLAGDFSAIDDTISDCAPEIACAVLLDKDGQTIIGQVKSVGRTSKFPAEISVIYDAPATATPAFIRIGKKNPPDIPHPFLPVKPSTTPENLVDVQQAIGGDFCEKDENLDCTTDFLRPEKPWKSAGDPHYSTDAIKNVTRAIVSQAGTSGFHSAKLVALGPDTADLSFMAPANFTPTSLTLDVNSGKSYTYAFIPAPPKHTSILNYESDEMSTICDQKTDPTDSSKDIPICEKTPRDHLVLKSVGTGEEIAFVALQGHLIIARQTTAYGEEAITVVVANTTTKKSIIARRTIKPGANINDLTVDITIMDQVTAQLNYGSRIAKRYIAVMLDVKNPTEKKLQFNKSAMYFDVDYVEARGRKAFFTDFWENTKQVSTLGLTQPSVYNPPFVAGRDIKDHGMSRAERKKANKEEQKYPRVARFGLEQNVKHSPVNYLSALGAFDHTTQVTDDKLKAIELVASVLSNIATGGIVADASGAFRAGTSIFSGTFLPGVRGIVLDNSFINRLRSNLVAQTLQETIQISARGSTTTVVLLPRTGILAFSDAEIPVMVDRVLDVHIVREVVTEVDTTPVTKGSCKPGMSKDQARMSLGEPSGLTTNPDGSSLFTFSKGPMASIGFTKDGVAASCAERSVSDQLKLAATLVDAKKVLSDNNLTPTEIVLTDSSTVLVDIPTINATFHYDAKGNQATDYTFLFSSISAEAAKKDEPKATLEGFLEESATKLSSKRSSDIKTVATPTDKAKTETIKAGGQVQVKYPSPDIQDGFVTVTYRNTGTPAKPTLVVDGKPTFEGPQPKGVE
jgi:hypothetical protein